ncbi:MAG TPA: glycosyltransferase 87 family protein [Pseudonocardia sp.]
MTASASARHTTTGVHARVTALATAVRDHPGRVYRYSVPVFLVSVAMLLAHLDGRFLDLEVYRLGVRTWLSGGDIYGPLPVTSAGISLPFIYPPFAALTMVPVTVTGWVVAWVTVFVVSLLSLAVTMYVVLRRLWPTAGRAVVLAGTSALVTAGLALDPVLETFKFGQVNLLLMAMVTVDCLSPRTRWPRGLLVGLAAAIKLTPAAFVLYFVLRRDYRAAAVTVVSAVAATGLSALVAPSASARYWLGGLAGASGVSGSPFYTNQTFQAVFARAGILGTGRSVICLVLSVGLLVLAVPVIRRAPAPLAMVTTAGVALLVSPTSWSHHWVWIAPALLVGGVTAWRARSRAWAVATAVLAVVFVVAPHQFLPHDQGREVGWPPVEQVLGDSYVIVTVVVYVLLGVSYRRRSRSALSDSGPGEAGPGDAAGSGRRAAGDSDGGSGGRPARDSAGDAAAPGGSDGAAGTGDRSTAGGHGAPARADDVGGRPEPTAT